MSDAIVISQLGLVAVGLGVLMSANASLMVMLKQDDIPTSLLVWTLIVAGYGWWAWMLYNVGAEVAA